MKQDDEALIRRLRKPGGPVDVVLDTDASNEIDDQYALAFLVKSGEQLRVKGICAAPFLNRKSSGPGDGMEKSYAEILHILSLLGREDLKGSVYRGSPSFLPSETGGVDSPAARFIADLAMGYTPERPLYVAAIGAITNVASALLLRPAIRDRIVIVWLGGHALHWPDSREFNLAQDVAAGRVIFGSGAALVQLPCMGVVSAFCTGGPELEHWLRGKNPLCGYLLDLTTREALKDGGLATWTRAIWDVTAVGWLLPGDYMLDRLEHSPIPGYDHHYSFDPRRHFYRYVYHIHRDKLFEALFTTLAR
jgi:inosine-uridine nucleoside N-ribohydrolase